MAAPLTPVDPDQVFIQSLLDRSVRIEYMCSMDDHDLMGSGVVVGHTPEGNSLVATAQHVTEAILDNECEIIVRDSKGVWGFGEVLRKDNDMDVAVIKVSTTLGTVAKMSDNVYLGMAITCVGWPMLPSKGVERLSVTVGNVSTLDVGGFLRISADLFFGSSGGACYSYRGEVVGIVSHFMAGGSAFGLPVPRPGNYYISDVSNLKELL